MGYKATLDIVIHLNAIRTKLFRRVGKIRYRVSLYHMENSEKIFCRPYNILRDAELKKAQQKYESELDHQGQCFYSKIHQIAYNDSKYIEHEACYFRSYIDAYQLQKCELNCKVQLMFAADTESNFKILGIFDAVIRKTHDITAYLPIAFDQFEGFSVSGTFNAAILDFKFETQYVKQKQSQQQKPDFADFWSFTEAATKGFRKNQTIVFYEYYRELLDNQLFSIQNRHSDLLRVNNINQNYPFMKISVNAGMRKLLSGLSEHSSPPISMKNDLTNGIMSEFQNIKALIYQKWNKLIEFIIENSQAVASYYEKNYQIAIKERLRINVFSHKISNHDWTYCKYQDSGKANIEHALADKNKNQDKQLWSQHFPVENLRFFGDEKRRIKIFEQKYVVNHDQLTQRSFRQSDSKAGITIKNKQSQMPTEAQQNSQKPISFYNSLVGGLGSNVSQNMNRRNFNQALHDNSHYDNIFRESNVQQNCHLNQNHYNYNSAPRTFAQSNVGPISTGLIENPHQHYQNRPGFGQNINTGPIYRNQNYQFAQSQVSFPTHQQKFSPVDLNQSEIKAKPGFLRKSFHKETNPMQINFKKSTDMKMLNTQKASYRKNSTGNAAHYVILVHGFQASRQDFFLIKSCLEIRYGIDVFISTANQGRTEDSILTLGKRLAMQIQNFLLNKDDDYRLSFIGHSLGGLIIRSALGFLDKIQSHLYTYISMSSPHLGYLYSPSALVQAGLWIINAWQKADSLQQLCMSDASNLRDCYLYKLAKQSTLQGFRKLIFVSSSQDQYTPYQSTRIQKNVKLLQQRFESTKGQVICEMVDALLGRVKCDQISRINVIFDIQDKNLDAWIGRTAHVKYLSDKEFIKKFFIAFDEFFLEAKDNQL